MNSCCSCCPPCPGNPGRQEAAPPHRTNNERYQQMLEELRKLAIFATRRDYDVFATTEHHFHSEAYETSWLRCLLYADLAARTKRMQILAARAGPSSWDPIRAARNSPCRSPDQGSDLCGLCARLPDRWVNVLGQQYHVTAPDGWVVYRQPQPEVLRREREGHSKGVDRGSLGLRRRVLSRCHIHIKKDPSLPSPDWTRSYGRSREIDEAGVVRKICVVPKPYQCRIRPCSSVLGERDDDPLHANQASFPDPGRESPDFQRLCTSTRCSRRTAGRNGLRLGESVGAFPRVALRQYEAERSLCLRDTNYRASRTIRRIRILGAFAPPRTRRSTRWIRNTPAAAGGVDGRPHA